MADRLGVKQPTICDWETEKVHPKSKDLRAIAEAYEVDVEVVVPDEEA